MIPTKPMKRIYITASYDRREEVVTITLELVQAGHEVTSTWALDESPVRTFPVQNEEDVQVNRNKAFANIQDIQSSDVFVCLSDEEYVRGGKHFEMGYAYSLCDNLYVVGHAELMQHYLANITILPDIEAFYEEVGLAHTIPSDEAPN